MEKKRKYIVVLLDGASDYKISELGGKTPLQVAKKPCIDHLAGRGTAGMVKTIPDGTAPGSDTANLSILGYDPSRLSSCRSSLEAVSIGVSLAETDATYRCNLVTLSDEMLYEEKTMVDYSAGEITTEESKLLIYDIAERLGTSEIKFYPGVSYRHVIVWNPSPIFSGKDLLVPPHDISGKKIRDYLPAGENGRLILDLMKRSSEILRTHPINKKRIIEGKNPANSIWVWARGKKPSLDNFYEKYGLKGSVISAVDLVKGIGICAGLKVVEVKGATGNIHTNFEGKADAAVSEIIGSQDFVYIHIEAPDECGHQGNIECKVKAIELIDEKIVKRIFQKLEQEKILYSMMLLPDHPTPISIRTHTAEPVPFLIYKSDHKNGHNKNGCNTRKGEAVFDEFYPQSTGLFIKDGFLLMDHFLKDK